MGGEHSGIGDATTTVFLEGAFWNPAVIQGKSRRLGFASDAGYRFERGVDFDGCARGGRARDAADPRDLRRPRRSARRRRRRAARRARRCACGPRAWRGCSASRSPPRPSPAIFDRLGLAHARDGDDFVVTPPSYRFDLAIEEDFVEEIARLHGYDAIPAAPSAHVQTMLADPEARRSAGALEAPPRRARLAGSDHLQLRRLGAGRRRCFPDRDAAPVADRRAESDRRAPRRDAHDAAGRPARGAADQSRPQARSRARLRDGPRLPAHRRRPRPAAAHRRRSRTATPLPEQWGAPRRPVDLFDVKARPRGAGRAARPRRPRGAAIRRCIRAAPPACASTAPTSAGSASCTRGCVRALRAAARADRCSSSTSRPLTRAPVPVAAPGLEAAGRPPRPGAGRRRRGPGAGGRRRAARRPASPTSTPSGTVRRLPRPRRRGRQEKPCDSGAYAGY